MLGASFLEPLARPFRSASRPFDLQQSWQNDLFAITFAQNDKSREIDFRKSLYSRMRAVNPS